MDDDLKCIQLTRLLYLTSELKPSIPPYNSNYMTLFLPQLSPKYMSPMSLAPGYEALLSLKFSTDHTEYKV